MAENNNKANTEEQMSTQNTNKEKSKQQSEENLNNNQIERETEEKKKEEATKQISTQSANTQSAEKDASLQTEKAQNELEKNPTIKTKNTQKEIIKDAPTQSSSRDEQEISSIPIQIPNVQKNSQEVEDHLEEKNTNQVIEKILENETNKGTKQKMIQTKDLLDIDLKNITSWINITSEKAATQIIKKYNVPPILAPILEEKYKLTQQLEIIDTHNFRVLLNKIKEDEQEEKIKSRMNTAQKYKPLTDIKQIIPIYNNYTEELAFTEAIYYFIRDRNITIEESANLVISLTPESKRNNIRDFISKYNLTTKEEAQKIKWTPEIALKWIAPEISTNQMVNLFWGLPQEDNVDNLLEKFQRYKLFASIPNEAAIAKLKLIIPNWMKEKILDKEIGIDDNNSDIFTNSVDKLITFIKKLWNGRKISTANNNTMDMIIKNEKFMDKQNSNNFTDNINIDKNPMKNNNNFNNKNNNNNWSYYNNNLMNNNNNLIDNNSMYSSNLVNNNLMNNNNLIDNNVIYNEILSNNNTIGNSILNNNNLMHNSSINNNNLSNNNLANNNSLNNNVINSNKWSSNLINNNTNNNNNLMNNKQLYWLNSPKEYNTNWQNNTQMIKESINNHNIDTSMNGNINWQQKLNNNNIPNQQLMLFTDINEIQKMYSPNPNNNKELNQKKKFNKTQPIVKNIVNYKDRVNWYASSDVEIERCKRESRCYFCGIYGHKINECRKYAKHKTIGTTITNRYNNNKKEKENEENKQIFPIQKASNDQQQSQQTD